MTRLVKAIASFDTMLAGVEALKEYVHKHSNGSFNYAPLHQEEDDGPFNYYERTGLPCYGELRPYAQGLSGNGPYEPLLMPEKQREVYKPTDLFYPFPQGNPVAVAVAFSPFDADGTKMIEDVVLNPGLSPWREVLKGFEIIYDKKDRFIGIVITNTHINPTTMVNMFRKINRHHQNSSSEYTKLLASFHTLSRLEAFVLAQMYYMSEKTKVIFYSGNDYNPMDDNPDFTRVFNGTPIDTTGGTFYDRYAYDRPRIDFLWGVGKGRLSDNVKARTGKTGHYAYHTWEHMPIIVEEFLKLVRV